MNVTLHRLTFERQIEVVFKTDLDGNIIDYVSGMVEPRFIDNIDHIFEDKWMEGGSESALTPLKLPYSPN